MLLTLVHVPWPIWVVLTLAVALKLVIMMHSHLLHGKHSCMLQLCPKGS